MAAFLICATGIMVSASETQPTIRIGETAPMTRNEFLSWREQQGIRFFHIEDCILPAEVFFDWYSGKSFRRGELNDRILRVYEIPGAVSNTVPVPSIIIEETAAEIQRGTSPVIFDGMTPIHFSYEELAEMIESAPKAGPLDAISGITLPNRRLTESELAAWVDEYNKMGGATAFELAVIVEINRIRVQYGLRPLALSPALMMSARMKTQEFADLQYFSHRSPVHGTPGEAARMFGFDGGVVESMTRAGRRGSPVLRSTPVGIVNGMLASTRGHREILLNPNLYSVGFGASFSPNSRGANGDMSHMFYFVTKFGFSHD
jgi:uncharacterized protein YkwD